VTQLLAGITLHENRADTRIWGGEATGAYTVKSGRELIDIPLAERIFPTKDRNVHMAATSWQSVY
jgi:hypothetical protein